VATIGAVALATLTPFCSCGTTAVLLGIPAYINTEGSLPLVALLFSGAIIVGWTGQLLL
jgi:hypothetical protein